MGLSRRLMAKPQVSDHEARSEAGQKGMTMKRLHQARKDNFKLVELPLSVESGILSLFRALPAGTPELPEHWKKARTMKHPWI
jgi:hypothetical protein